MANNLLIATWNVNSILARLPHVTRWLDAVKPDVLCMQETKCTDDKFPVEVFKERGYECLMFGQQSYNGVAILSRGECATKKYAFKLDWLHRLRQFFDEHYDNSSPVLLCGDFNVAPEERDVHDPRLWQGRILFSDQERAALQNLKDWGFVDTFRLHTEAGGHYSWWDYRAGAFRRNMGLRIDHIWVSQPLAARNKNTSIDLEPRTWERPSDHAPVVAEFDV